MPAVKKIVVPESPSDISIEWIQGLVRTLNLLLEARVDVNPPNTTKGVESLTISGTAIIIPVPLELAAPIANSTATAASASAQLNLLLAALRQTGQLPTAS